MAPKRLIKPQLQEHSQSLLSTVRPNSRPIIAQCFAGFFIFYQLKRCPAELRSLTQSLHARRLLLVSKQCWSLLFHPRRICWLKLFSKTVMWFLHTQEMESAAAMLNLSRQWNLKSFELIIPRPSIYPARHVQ
eukprot:Rmarinus@m.20876